MTPDSALFTAGHGFYQFAVTRDAFDRSLYYNLLLQPSLAVPDHYLLQGRWLHAHLNEYPGRDSWLESGLRNGFVTPYFRQGESRLSNLLSVMKNADRRGFNSRAQEIAERLDRTPFQALPWSSGANSTSFGAAVRHYLEAPDPPMMEMITDPDDFLGFWTRSRTWIDRELEIAGDRSTDLLGSDGLLLSQLIQVSGERLLGPDCGRIGDISDLLSRVSHQVGLSAERDLRVYYTVLCELYNRSLADAMFTAPNSPKWEHYVAAMDLWREQLIGTDVTANDLEVDAVVRLPRPRHLRSVSGDVLLSIRKTQACERYFESLTYWRANPHNEQLREELVSALEDYSREIMKQVGKDIGALGLRPQFISRASDLSQIIEKVPGVLQGFLAVGAAAGAAGVAAGTVSPLVPAALFSLFCLRIVAKHHAPSQKTSLSIAPGHGLRVRPDITITRH